MDGIFQLMDSRSFFLSNYPGFSGEPVISNINHSTFIHGNDLWITAHVSSSDYVSLNYRFGKNQRFKEVEMFDDGAHNDGFSGDGVYGGKISNSSNSIDYYFYAENDSAGVFSPKRAAYEYHHIYYPLDPYSVVINELMSNNTSTANDNSGKYEDWIELYNPNLFSVSTKNLFLSDTLSNLNKWGLPNYVIDPDSYLIIWADEDGNQGELHANFKLSNNGETLILTRDDSSILDSVTYSPQVNETSFGRSPNGNGQFTVLTPTFNSNNNFPNLSVNYKNEISVFPNPFSNFLKIKTEQNFVVRDVVGKIIYFSKNSNAINTSKWHSGVYFVSLLDNSLTLKIIKI